MLDFLRGKMTRFWEGGIKGFLKGRHQIFEGGCTRFFKGDAPDFGEEWTPIVIRIKVQLHHWKGNVKRCSCTIEMKEKVQPHHRKKVPSTWRRLGKFDFTRNEAWMKHASRKKRPHQRKNVLST